MLMGMTVTLEDVYRIFQILTIRDLVYYDYTTDGATFWKLSGDDSIGDDSVF